MWLSKYNSAEAFTTVSSLCGNMIGCCGMVLSVL